MNHQIIMRMTKKDVVQQFRWDWSDFLKSNPNFREIALPKDVHLMIMLTHSIKMV